MSSVVARSYCHRCSKWPLTNSEFPDASFSFSATSIRARATCAVSAATPRSGSRKPSRSNSSICLALSALGGRLSARMRATQSELILRASERPMTDVHDNSIDSCIIRSYPSKSSDFLT